MNERKQYFDILRIIASFFVIVNHTNSYVFLSLRPSPTWFLSVSWFFICKTAIPLFLMISGALLLSRRDPFQTSLTRFGRRFVTFFVFSLGCYCFYALEGVVPGGFLPFLDTFLAGGTGVTNAYWYMYLYLGLLLLMPLLQHMAAVFSDKEIRWLLFLSIGVLGTLPLLGIAASHSTSFFPQEAFFSTYIALLFAGLYLDRSRRLRPRHIVIAGAVFVFLILFQTLATYYIYKRSPDWYLHLDNRCFITITLSSICLFLAGKVFFSRHPLSDRAGKRISGFSKLTFGIYLFSDPLIFLTRPFFNHCAAHVNLLLAALLWELLAFAAAALLTALLRMIPPVKRYL